MNQTYSRSRLSPYQPKPQHPIELIRAKVYDVQDKKNPIRAAIEQCLGTHTITAVIEEDIQTITTMGVDGLVSFLCTLSENGRILSQGRGSVVMSPTNRFIQRAIACAFNSSIADAAIRASKILDLVRDKSEVEIEESMRDSESEPVTDKQREYIRQLVRKIEDRAEREDWESRLGKMTKAEASRAIEDLK